MQHAPITLILIIINVGFSVYAFSNPIIIDRYKFEVGAILYRKEWYRLITSGFLHANWMHLLMNMLSLYFMGPVLEAFFTGTAMFSRYDFIYERYGDFGRPLYLILYFGSMIGGDLLALLFKRKDPHYSAIGASGAISGVVFAVAMLAPTAMVQVFFIPMPFWLYAILYVAYTLFGMKSNADNIGHEAHMGGALAGLLIFVAAAPDFLIANWWFFLILFVPSVLGIYLLKVQPEFVNDPGILFRKRSKWTSTTKKPKGLEINQRAFLQAELDRLLDKVGRKGIDSLTDEERKRLHEVSERLGKEQRGPKV